jgi:hypothetical protein
MRKDERIDMKTVRLKSRRKERHREGFSGDRRLNDRMKYLIILNLFKHIKF